MTQAVIHQISKYLEKEKNLEETKWETVTIVFNRKDAPTLIASHALAYYTLLPHI